jgi:hypothetical protein
MGEVDALSVFDVGIGDRQELPVVARLVGEQKSVKRVARQLASHVRRGNGQDLSVVMAPT